MNRINKCHVFFFSWLNWKHNQSITSKQRYMPYQDLFIPLHPYTLWMTWYCHAGVCSDQRGKSRFHPTDACCLLWSQRVMIPPAVSKGVLKQLDLCCCWVVQMNSCKKKKKHVKTRWEKSQKHQIMWFLCRHKATTSFASFVGLFEKAWQCIYYCSCSHVC